jgi:hypothetical protein
MFNRCSCPAKDEALKKIVIKTKRKIREGTPILSPFDSRIRDISLTVLIIIGIGMMKFTGYTSIYIPSETVQVKRKVDKIHMLRWSVHRLLACDRHLIKKEKEISSFAV